MLSHIPQPLDDAIDRVRARIQPHDDVTIEEQLQLLDALTEFPFGRFLLCNRGWDASWTHYAVVYHPRHGRRHGVDAAGRPLTPLEKRILDLPVCRATQERFVHFQRILQGIMRDGIRMTSVPCGMADDLLTLDIARDVHLVGIDLDGDALRLAAENAATNGVVLELRQVDAWALPESGEFDVVTSNGLNIYEPSDDRVVALYRGFRGLLRPRGTLVTSHLTPADEHAALDPDDLRLQRIIFGDILRVNWNHPRSTATTCAQLETAGFEVDDVIRDAAGIFPTFVARVREDAPHVPRPLCES